MLERRGAGSSKAKPGEAQPAEFIFHGAYLTSARQSTPEFKKFASFAGSILLDRESRIPVFECAPDAAIVYDEPEPGEDEPVRKIRLDYDEASFRNAPRQGSEPRRLRLPVPPEKARFFELGVELRIGGDTEGALGVNGRLDIPLGPIEDLETTLPRDQLVGAAQLMMPRHFVAWLTFIFGHDIPHSAYQKLHAELLSGVYRMTPIEIVSSLPDDHIAGYDRSTKKIKIKRSFVRAAENDENEAAVLLIALIEEFGHAIDDDLRTRLSRVGGDAEFDEGAAFGYAICNLGWDLKDEAEFAVLHRDGESIPLRVKWPVFRENIERVLSPEEQRADDMAGAIEFFGAGRGHGKPHQSFAHESIEDVLKESFPDATVRKEIYFGNWLRDFSQGVSPFGLEMMAMAGKVLDSTLPGTSGPVMRLQSDPRGMITDILDVYARAQFADLPHFRVTKARLGVYRSEEHIDNPDGLETSTLDPGFDRDPVEAQTNVDSATQIPGYINGRLPRPAKSAVEYLREEFAAAVAAGPTPEGRRRFGQGLHTLEDLYAHTNFCELALRTVGKTKVEPWTKQVTQDGKTFFPLVSGKFGAIDSGGSILFIIGETMEADLDKPCEAGKRSIGVRIALIILRDLRPHIAKQLEGALENVEAFKAAHPIIFTAMCRETPPLRWTGKSSKIPGDRTQCRRPERSTLKNSSAKLFA